MADPYGVPPHDSSPAGCGLMLVLGAAVLVVALVAIAAFVF